MVLFVAPGVKPAVPHFHAHFGNAREHFVVLGEVFFHAAAEIERGQATFGSAVEKILPARSVRRKKRNIYSAFSVTVVQILQVFFVVAVITVLVFALHHYDVAAVGA